jgi:hypothetical protein
MAAFLCGKGQILWDVTLDIGYVQQRNFLAPGSRDMLDANNKAVDYLFRALCQSEFDRVHTENLACTIRLERATSTPVQRTPPRARAAVKMKVIGTRAGSRPRT